MRGVGPCGEEIGRLLRVGVRVLLSASTLDTFFTGGAFFVAGTGDADIADTESSVSAFGVGPAFPLSASAAHADFTESTFSVVRAGRAGVLFAEFAVAAVAVVSAVSCFAGA